MRERRGRTAVVLGLVAALTAAVVLLRRARSGGTVPVPEPAPAWPPLTVTDATSADVPVPDDGTRGPHGEEHTLEHDQVPDDVGTHEAAISGAPPEDDDTAGAPPEEYDTSTPPDGPTAAWVEPDEGACPVTHPVKAKTGSGIFHVPGGLSYDRTRADRCYASPEAAEGDGFRAAKR